MTQEQIELINYRLQRSQETLQEVGLLLNAGHNNTAVSRLYYSCFYAVQALLLTEEFSSSKHSGIRSLFNHNWVKTGRIPKELGNLYNELFTHRQRGDYGDFVTFEVSEVDEWLKEATTFVETISVKVKENIGK